MAKVTRSVIVMEISKPMGRQKKMATERVRRKHLDFGMVTSKMTARQRKKVIGRDWLMMKVIAKVRQRR